MANESLIFDAAGSNIDGSSPGSPLLIGPGSNYGLREGTEFPAAPLDVMYASSVDMDGELPVHRRYGNRTLTVKLMMDDSTGALLAALQAKYAKFQRSGGTLKRVLPNGDVRIYDILAADGWSPSYDFAYWLGDVVEVTMTLPAAPLSRGVEVDLGDNVETTLPALIFTDSVPGDVEGLGRLVIDEDQAQLQRTVMWGIQCANYSSASTANLFFQAEALTVLAGATAVGPAGASGAGSNTIFNTSLSNLAFISQWQLSGTHAGTFRAFARFQVPVTNTGTVSLRMYYQSGLDPFNYGDTVSFASSTYGGNWLLVDLGLVNARTALKGTRSLTIGLDAMSTTLNDDLYTDWLMLIPGDEGSGCASSSLAGADPINPLNASGTMQVDYQSVESRVSAGTTWGRPAKYEGDYLMVPPSGPEARTVRVIVKASRGRLFGPVLPAGFSASNYADAGIDDISARLYVTPRYVN
jgi:hypothetical protein